MTNSVNTKIANYPVSTSLLKGGDRDGVIASLVGMAPLDKIKISGFAPSLPSNYQTKLNHYSFNASMAYNLGLAGLVDFKGSGTVHYLLSDFSAVVKHERNDDSIIQAEYYAVGYRIAVKAWGLKTKSGISLSSIAADCTVNGSKSAVQINVFGIAPDKTLEALPGLSAISGNFDMTTLQSLGGISNALTQYISEHYATLTPALVAVDLNLSRIDAAYDNSASTILGLSGIARGNDYNTTMDKQPDGGKLPSGITIEGSMVKQMYNTLMPTPVTDTATPDSQVKKSAAKSNFRGE